MNVTSQAQWANGIPAHVTHPTPNTDLSRTLDQRSRSHLPNLIPDQLRSSFPLDECRRLCRLVEIVAPTYSRVHRAVMPTAEKGQSREEVLGDVRQQLDIGEQL